MSTPPKQPTKKKEEPKIPQERKHRPATEADMARAGIPAGYSVKHWDPDDEPLTVLGSVFDANSLGKWIYDWACHRHGKPHPMSDLAAEFWLQLITLSSGTKRADDKIEFTRQKDNIDTLHEFLDGAERLWIRRPEISVV